MIGDHFWSTGVSVKWDGRGKFGATVKFFDDGFCEDSTTEGELRTRYFEPLPQAIDTIIADAKRMGIVFRDNWFLYIEGDGKSRDWPPPDDWRRLLTEQAARLGCATYTDAD